MIDMIDTLHDPVDVLTADARAVVTRSCAPVPPDFAAVLARAQRVASEDARDEFAENLAQAQRDAAHDDEQGDVVDIRARVRHDAEPGGLDALIGDARVSVGRMIEQRRMQAIPPLPVVRPRRRVAAVGVAFGLLAAAAIALWSVRGWVELQPTAPEGARDQAFDIDMSERSGGHAVEPEPEPVPRTVAPRRGVVSPPIVESIVESIVEVDSAPAVEPSSPRVRADADHLRTLSDEARTRWRAGDRRGAEAKFQQVTAAGGRSPLAELAWGDLFALARQLGDDARLAKRWRAYLGKFPRGQYADDARAGLCRRDDDRSRCWATYLRDFPDGSYRGEARDATNEP